VALVSDASKDPSKIPQQNLNLSHPSRWGSAKVWTLEKKQQWVPPFFDETSLCHHKAMVLKL